MQRPQVSVVVVVCAILACQSDQPVASRLGSPTAEISDANHAATGFASNPHFFFLPPLVSPPNPTGVFNPRLSPVVQVCDVLETPCPDHHEHARFSSTVRLDLSGQQYAVNWNTTPSSEPVGASYRIAVIVHKGVLGFADVDMVSNAAMKHAAVDIPLVDGRTLPIKFRIEDGALCPSTATLDCTEQLASPTTDNTIITGDQMAGTFIPAGALKQPVTVSIVANQTRPCIPAPFALPQYQGCYDFFTDPGPQQFNTPVTVGICIDTDLPQRLGALLALFQFDAGRPVRPLPEVSAFFLQCDATDPYKQGVIGSRGSGPPRWVALARAGVRRALRYLGPTSLFAGHNGVGGTTDSYSTIGWALPVELAVHDGDGQRAAPGTAVPIAPSVIVRDSGGAPVPGVTVNFAVRFGGGSVTPSVVTTGTDGIARVTSWTLGTTVGADTLRASVVGAVPESVFFHAEAVTPLAWAQVGAGNQHTCAATADSIPYCWGRNGFGQLGNGTTTPSLIPRTVAGSHFFASITAQGFDVGSGDEGHSCGASGGPAGGAGAFCWGQGAENQLGNGSTANQSSPVAVSGGSGLVQVSINVFHTCAVAGTGAAYCWGLGANGRLGTADVANQSTPAAVVGGHSFRMVSAGGTHTCGVTTTSNDAYCWGNNRQGELGRGAAPGGGPATAQDSIPILVAGGHKWLSVSAGNTHTCGVTTLNEAYCWGNDEHGRLGTAGTPETCPGLSTGTTTTCHTSPVAVTGGLSFGSVSAGTFHTCGVTTGGAAYCWGANRFGGELGDGLAEDTSAVPVAVSGGNSYLTISAGTFHTCAVRTDLVLFCWGSNGGGELGDGTTVARSTPVRVAEP